jgi:hypothetical protein
LCSRFRCNTEPFFDQFLLANGRGRERRRLNIPEHLQRFERHFDGAVGGVEDGAGAVLTKEGGKGGLAG